MNRMIGAAALIGLLAVGACGGGGEEPALSVSDLDYSNSASVRHSYTEYETGSYAYSVTRGDAATLVYIGGDQEPRENLSHVWTESDIRFFMGASRDGVGVDRLKNYEHDLLTSDDTDPFGLLNDDGFYPFLIQPHLYGDTKLAAASNAGILIALIDAIEILNDALPPEYQIDTQTTRTNETAYGGEIFVRLESPETIASICGTGAVACANSTISETLKYTHSSVLYLPDDLDTSEYVFPRSVIVHELLHALGISGHVDSVEFPDSVMGGTGEYIPSLGHIISKIDREVLQIMYMNKRTDLYNDWGEWSDTSFHVMGESLDGALKFGVALFNGLPQPWAIGVKPDTDLADNESLSGTATWTGSLLGFSGPSPLAGDAELEIDLGTLADDGSEQNLRFRDIYYLNRIESDTTDSSDRWFDTRNIDYKVAVAGNWFENVIGDDYEQGLVTGAFLGAGHEHMAGTVKRTDVIGAFGGSRAEEAE